MFERLGNAVAWLTFIGSVLYSGWHIVFIVYFFFIDSPERVNINLIEGLIWGLLAYVALQALLYVVWGKMRFLPWKG